jgi:hypothetical protein
VTSNGCSTEQATTVASAHRTTVGMTTRRHWSRVDDRVIHERMLDTVPFHHPAVWAEPVDRP